MVNLRFKTVIFSFFIFCLHPLSYSQNVVDSLLHELSISKSKSGIYNQLAEATIEDSLELSFEYAQKALKASRLEKNENQLGIAWFSIAEVYSYQYNWTRLSYIMKRHYRYLKKQEMIIMQAIL